MTWRDHLRRLVLTREDGPVVPSHWARTYDVSEDTILLAIAGFRQERDDIEALRVRQEAEGD